MTRVIGWRERKRNGTMGGSSIMGFGERVKPENKYRTDAYFRWTSKNARALQREKETLA
jgi:hypothetical protein